MADPTRVEIAGGLDWVKIGPPEVLGGLMAQWATAGTGFWYRNNATEEPLHRR